VLHRPRHPAAARQHHPALLWLGLLLNLDGTFTDISSAVVGAAAGYLALWSVFWLFKLTTGKEGMGYGDFKLLAAIGAWLGWQILPLTILLSSLVGAVVGIALIVLRKHGREIPIPFGPYLAAAGLLALYWGKPSRRPTWACSGHALSPGHA
jgi:leader peptidase (prepilin peptidase)/N-methyltransferase